MMTKAKDPHKNDGPNAKEGHSYSPEFLSVIFATYTVVIPLMFTAALGHLVRGGWFALRKKDKEQFQEFLAGAALWGRVVARMNGTKVECVNRIEPPDHGHFIFINHVNELDFPFDSLVVRKPYLANQVIKRAVFAYVWMRAMGSQVFDATRARTIKASVDNLLRHLPTQSYIVYPEGGNTYSEKIRPFRRGMIRVAFENHIPVYLTVKSGLAAFQKRARGNTVAYCSCGVFDPKDYETADDFGAALYEAMVREKAQLDAHVSRSKSVASAA